MSGTSGRTCWSSSLRPPGQRPGRTLGQPACRTAGPDEAGPDEAGPDKAGPVPTGPALAGRGPGGPALAPRAQPGNGLRSELLVPFVAALVPEVDVAAGRLVIDPPPGLLELGAGTEGS